VLSKDAATIVADRDGKELSHIWIKVNEKQILHDLYVANVARKLVKEEEEKSLVLDYMVPECGLKKGGKLKKGIYYPDLLFAVKGPTQQNRFCFEADCGTISKADFLGKINYFNDTILVVTRTESRLELLLRYLKVERITKLVCLTIFREFMPTALSECTWRTNLSDNLVSLALP
jgi:hypothetical protein